MARPCKIGLVKVCMDFENLGGCLPDSSRLVCQGLVEEGEGLLPSPPATSKIQVAYRKREVGTSGGKVWEQVFPIKEQEETEEGMKMMMMMMTNDDDDDIGDDYDDDDDDDDDEGKKDLRWRSRCRGRRRWRKKPSVCSTG